jgi:hypothetical protein
MTRVPGARLNRILLGGALALCGAVLTLSACGDDSGDNEPLDCGLDTGESVISGDLTVSYQVTLEGNGAVTSVTYTADAGPTTVANPSLPFSANITLDTRTARIEATGSVTTGTITAQYVAVGAPDREEQDQAICAQNP